MGWALSQLGGRNFQTCQGRLPEELRLRGLRTLDQANRLLKRRYIRDFNRKFRVEATEPGTAFVPEGVMDLSDLSDPTGAVVNRDNTVSWNNYNLHIKPTKWRASFVGCRVVFRGPLPFPTAAEQSGVPRSYRP